jgi:hypothetical protein
MSNKQIFINPLKSRKMKTPENNNGAAQGTATATAKNNAAKTNTQTVNRPSIPGKDKDKTDEPAKTETAAAVAEAAPAPSAETKSPANEQQAGTMEQPKGEEVKAEAANPEVQYIKPALNLEQTVKAVEGLHRKNIQRLALIARIKTLEDFQIKLAENSDQLESNVYQGCKLIIEDDRGNKFITNTPNLIAMVSQFVYDACVNKLAEIESEIVFPAA